METKIKIDLSAKLASKEPLIIELGCGPRKQIPGSIGIDCRDIPGVDIAADMEKGLSFLPDNSVDKIYSRHFIEHIDNLECLLEETVRVLKPHGVHQVVVPHFSNPFFYSDYTHKRFFGLYSFYYFCSPNNQRWRKVPPADVKFRIKILSARLVFKSRTNPFNMIFGNIFNLHSLLQDFYEENLCYLIPCYELKIIYSPEK
jgi:SAM-dependent methyltransferase